MNYYAIRALFVFRTYRMWRRWIQGVVAPVVSTSLYFVVFGPAMGAHMGTIDGLHYSAFIVPGLMMLALLTHSIGNASFGIYMPKFIGTIYEIHSAPISYWEVVIGLVGASALKSIILAMILLVTARIFVNFEIVSPGWMLSFVVLTSVSFSLFGFLIGIWAKSFESLRLIPLLIVTPLTFLGGGFYSINMLPDFWRMVTLFNPMVYLVNGFRWSFYGVADVHIGLSIGVSLLFLFGCMMLIRWSFKTGYRLKP